MVDSTQVDHSIRIHNHTVYNDKHSQNAQEPINLMPFSLTVSAPAGYHLPAQQKQDGSEIAVQDSLPCDRI